MVVPGGMAEVVAIPTPQATPAMVAKAVLVALAPTEALVATAVMAVQFQ